MTDWERVEKLRAKGKDWANISEDPRVGFSAPKGTVAGRALKVLYFQRRASGQGKERRESPTREGVRWGGFTRQRMVLLAIVVAMIIVVAYLIYLPSGQNGRPTGWVGREAPEFSLPIANEAGTFTLSVERGHKNVLLFFNEGLSCAPCLNQMQQLDSNAADFTKMHVMIVSITGDSQGDMANWASNSHVTNTDVCADPTLQVSNMYDTTGAAESMMPGTAPGHTFILVNETGVVIWRGDYGPSDMSVPLSEIVQNTQNALSTYG